MSGKIEDFLKSLPIASFISRYIVALNALTNDLERNQNTYHV